MFGNKLMDKRLSTPPHITVGANRIENIRLDYIDFAKGLGMLLIIWGHIRIGDWSNAFVYAFHIPLFFFLSGMVFSKRRYPDFKKFFLKKLKSLLVMYVFFSVLTWVFWVGYSYLTHSQVESYWMPLAQTFIAQGSEGFLVHNVPLWFVTCLFIVEIAYYFISNLPKLWILIVTLALSSICYYLINYVDVFDMTLLPWSIDVAMLVVPFYAAGSMLVDIKSHFGIISFVTQHKTFSMLLAIFSACVIFILSRYNGSISFGHAYLGHNVYVTYCNGCIGIVMWLILCILLSDTSLNKRDTKIMCGIKWFGRNSFNAMAIHNPIKGGVCAVIGILLTNVHGNSFYSIIAFIITIVVTVIGILVINKCIERIPILYKVLK